MHVSAVPTAPDPQTSPTLAPPVLAELDRGTDWLGSWWPAAVLGVVGTAAVALWWRRRRRGAPRAWWAAAAAVPLLVGAGAAAVNAEVGYLPSLEAAELRLTGRTWPATGGGRVSTHRIDVPADLRVPVSTTWVYTPPGYDPDQATRYPVVYLLHGTPGSSADWFVAGGIAHVMDVLVERDLVQPMIVVAPDTRGEGISDTECLDSTRGGPQVETYLNDVVLPWVDANYRTAAHWRHRVIGGMSAGAFCALDQGLRHQELYGVVLALEAYETPGDGGRAMLATQAEFDARSPGAYVPSMDFAHPVPTFLDVGGRARGGDSGETQRLVAQLLARGQPVLFREEPGLGHTWTMARTGIPYGLVFASRNVPPPEGSAPSAPSPSPATARSPQEHPAARPR